MDTSDTAIEDGINNAMNVLRDEQENNGPATNDDSKGSNGAHENEVQEVAVQDDEYQKVHMEYAVKRPQIHLWKYIQGLQSEINCKAFYDIEIYCQDGVVSWNRLLLALCHPEFHFLIYPDEREDLMVHLPETLGEDLLKTLQSAIDDPPIGTVEAVDPDAEVKYTLVQHVWPKDYDYPTIDWDEGDDEEVIDDDDGEYQPGAWIGPDGQGPKMEAKMEPVEVFQQCCEVCDQEFYNAEQFEDHAKVHNPQLIRFNCGITQCGQGFIVEKLYQAHVKLHEKELRDAEIDKRAKELMELQDPVSEGARPLWRCIECGFENKLKHTVIVHCEIHLDNISHPCHLCTNVCKTRNALRTHIYRKHPETIERVMPSKRSGITKQKEDADYSTDDDDYEPLEFDEKARESTKRGKRPAYEKICPQCNDSFDSRKKYDDHAKVHNPDMIKFTCNQCLEGFIVESLYKEHCKVHDVERTQAMGEAGIYQEVMTMISTTYDEDQKCMLYTCNQCEYKSARRIAVHEHCEKHIGGIAHQCPVCSHVAPTKNALRVHTVRKHQTSKWLSLSKNYTPAKKRKPNNSTASRNSGNQHVIHYTPQTPSTPGYSNTPTYASNPNSPGHQVVQMHKCPHCYKSSPTSNALRMHISRHHKEVDQGPPPPQRGVKREYNDYGGQQNYGSQQDAAKALAQQLFDKADAQYRASQQAQGNDSRQHSQQSSSSSSSSRNIVQPKATKSQPSGQPAYTQLKPPAAHSGHHNQTTQPLLNPQQALALQAQQNAFPDFFWNKY